MARTFWRDVRTWSSSMASTDGWAGCISEDRRRSGAGTEKGWYKDFRFPIELRAGGKSEFGNRKSEIYFFRFFMRARARWFSGSIFRTSSKQARARPPNPSDL